MNHNDVAVVLDLHKKWIQRKKGGKKANLQDANLKDADLWGANLQNADLWGASLKGADLQGADLDFSCLPLYCGGSYFKTDSRVVRQIIAHVCTLDVADADDELRLCLDTMRIEALKSHRAHDLKLS